jgi:hypothetical protein
MVRMRLDLPLAAPASNDLHIEVVKHLAHLAIGRSGAAVAGHPPPDVQTEPFQGRSQVGCTPGSRLKARDGAGDGVHIDANDVSPQPECFDNRRAADDEGIEDNLPCVVDALVIRLPEVCSAIELRRDEERSERGAETTDEPPVSLINRSGSPALALAEGCQLFDREKSVVEKRSPVGRLRALAFAACAWSCGR